MSETREAEVRRFVGGPLMTACYALIVPGENSVIIDAPRNAWAGAIKAANELDAPVSLAIATHGDWDHITDMARLQERGIPVAGHAADHDFFANPMQNRQDLPFAIDPVTLDRRLADGDRLDVAGLDIQVLHTPGHSPGSICLYVPGLDVLFTGDTVLKGGAGLLQRPASDPRALAASVLRIAKLPEGTTLYPGHGAPTTIGAEHWLTDSDNPETLIEHWRTGRQRWTPRMAR